MRFPLIMPDDAPPLIRDLPLIRRYARRNEEADYRFRDYLKTRLNVSNTDLDATVRETTDAVWAQIDCTACAHCCRSLQIVVDDRDIRRLARRMGVTTAAFARQYVGVAADGVKHFLASPCSFLGADGCCAVYEDRPQACRDFPYLHEPNFRGRTLAAIENTATCPIVFNVWQDLKRRFPATKR